MQCAFIIIDQHEVASEASRTHESQSQCSLHGIYSKVNFYWQRPSSHCHISIYIYLAIDLRI